jgi:site-specific DNA-methyltransferase (adenine-specific)
MAMVSKKLFSSATDEWATDPKLFAALDKLFHFSLDPCATPENAKCKLFYTRVDDGLALDWSGLRVFCNPPYGRGIGKWVRKCYESSLDGALVVLLVPSRTDTNWFHTWVQDKAEIHFMKGRQRFSNAMVNAPFPSLIAIYGREQRHDNRRLMVCESCDDFFQAERSDARTCSNACRQAAYDYRRKCKENGDA